MFPLLSLTTVYLIIFWWKLKKAYNKDFDIFIDKSNRYEIVESEDSSATKTTHQKGTYFRVPECSVSNKKGKILYMYSLGKPNPMELKYNNSKWIDSESTRHIFNNDMIQKMISQKDALKDSLFYVVVLCCVINTLLTAAMALKIFGVIK